MDHLLFQSLADAASDSGLNEVSSYSTFHHLPLWLWLSRAVVEEEIWQIISMTARFNGGSVSILKRDLPVPINNFQIARKIKNHEQTAIEPQTFKYRVTFTIVKFTAHTIYLSHLKKQLFSTHQR